MVFGVRWCHFGKNKLSKINVVKLVSEKVISCSNDIKRLVWLMIKSGKYVNANKRKLRFI